MVWYFHLFKNFPQFVVIHTVKGFGIVNKTEIDVFLELSYFFDYSVDVDSWISGSFIYSSVYIYVNPKLLIYPSPLSLFGSRKFVFYVCGSVSILYTSLFYTEYIVLNENIPVCFFFLNCFYFLFYFFNLILFYF